MSIHGTYISTNSATSLPWGTNTAASSIIYVTWLQLCLSHLVTLILMYFTWNEVKCNYIQQWTIFRLRQVFWRGPHNHFYYLNQVCGIVFCSAFFIALKILSVVFWLIYNCLYIFWEKHWSICFLGPNKALHCRVAKFLEMSCLEVWCWIMKFFCSHEILSLVFKIQWLILNLLLWL